MRVRAGLQADDGAFALYAGLYALRALGGRSKHPFGHLVRRRGEHARRLWQHGDHAARRGQCAHRQSASRRRGRTPARDLREARRDEQDYTACGRDRDSGGRTVVRDQRTVRVGAGRKRRRDRRECEFAALQLQGEDIGQWRHVHVREPELQGRKPFRRRRIHPRQRREHIR